MAEAKLGELLKSMPDFHSSGRGTMKRKELPSGITPKQSHYAQTLASSPEVIEEVVEKARERGNTYFGWRQANYAQETSKFQGS